jgi:CRP-like cAMP-binding protein
MRDSERWVDITERVLHLRSIPVGAVLSPPVLKVIAENLRECSFEKGEALMREGQPIDTFHMLTEGGLTLTRRGTLLGELKPPQTLGFLGIIARSEGTYDAIAELPTKALLLDAATLMELLEDHFSLLHATLVYAAERFLYEIKELPAEELSIPVQELPFPLPDRELDFLERLLFLRSLSVFKQTNLNLLAQLSNQLREVRYPAGTPLWRSGDTVTCSTLVVAGTLSCEADDGRRFRYGTGTAAGGVESIASKPRWFTATAETPVIVLEGRPDELIDLLEDNFAMAMDFVGMFASGLVGLLERKAARGQQPLAVLRNVSKLGAVPVGA